MNTIILAYFQIGFLWSALTITNHTNALANAQVKTWYDPFKYLLLFFFGLILTYILWPISLGIAAKKACNL